MSDQPHVAPLPGDGMVLCHGGLVAVMGAGAEPAVQALLELLQRHAGEPPVVLSRTVVGHLAAASEPPPPLGVVVLNDAGGHLLLHGPMTATVMAPAAEQHHDGRDAALCVDAALPADFAMVTVTMADTATGAPPVWARLVDGLVPGGGAVIAPTSTPAGTQQAGTHQGVVDQPVVQQPVVQQPVVQQPVVQQPVVDQPVAGQPVAGQPVQPAVADPSGTSSTAAVAQPLQPVLVDGVECHLGHFNHPFALRCATCQSSLVAATRQTVKGPRPPLGTIAFDDGARYELDADYVVGREPADDPAVTAGEARPLPLDDPEQAVSRVHAEIRLQDWDVVIVDRGSANGVHLLAPEGTDWRRIGAGQSAVISPGTQVAFGRRVMTYTASD